MKLNLFKKQLPTNAEIFAVFSVVIFFVHSWSVRGFLYKLPSFLLYLSVWDILSVFSYMMAFALLEGILVTTGLVFLGVVLPKKWFRDGFVYKAFLVLLVIAIDMILLQKTMGINLPDVHALYREAEITVLVLLGLILLFHNIPPLQKIVVYLVDGFGIMVYIYVPIGAISLLVVLIRNLF